MTAEETAKDLVRKFQNEVRPWVDFETQLIECKQCALIAVDEIISVLDEISIQESGTTKIDFGQGFYEEVKNEIEKL